MYDSFLSQAVKSSLQVTLGESRSGPVSTPERGSHNPEVQHQADNDDHKVGDKAQAQEPTNDVECNCSCLQASVTLKTTKIQGRKALYDLYLSYTRQKNLRITLNRTWAMAVVGCPYAGCCASVPASMGPISLVSADFSILHIDFRTDDYSIGSSTYPLHISDLYLTQICIFFANILQSKTRVGGLLNFRCRVCDLDSLRKRTEPKSDAGVLQACGLGERSVSSLCPGSRARLSLQYPPFTWDSRSFSGACFQGSRSLALGQNETNFNVPYLPNF